MAAAGPRKSGGRPLLPAPAVLLLLLCWVEPGAQFEGLVPVPPMGYSTRNELECKVTEGKVTKAAKTLKKLGLLAAGYRYVNLDDCWMAKERTAEGRLEANPQAFPNGMAALVKGIKELGFKFGIYTSRGPTTCVGLPASMGNEEVDAKTFADWGVDFLKNDPCWDPECGPQQQSYPGSGICAEDGKRKAVEKYAKMQAALLRTGHEIVHAVSGQQPWFAPVGRQLGHMWRVGADVRDWEGVYEVTRLMEQLVEFHGPNGWTDLDLLIGSTSGALVTLSPVQARAQFSLWCVLAVPLILGVKVDHMSAWDVETYGNRDAIKINQDPLAKTPRVASASTCPPYPKFEMAAKPDGSPSFKIPPAFMYAEGVVCGSHHARSCSECPQGHGEGWCHGECRWASATKRCVPQENPGEKREHIKLEDSADPWQFSVFRHADLRQCQQVWTRELSGGWFAVVVVNFASEAAAMSIPLEKLDLPGSSNQVLVQDLWAKSAVANPMIVADKLELQLKPDGGHVLLRIRQARNSSCRGASTATASRQSSPDQPNGAELSPAEERLRRIAQRAQVRERLRHAHAGMNDDDDEYDEGGSDDQQVVAQPRSPWVGLAALPLLVALALLLRRSGLCRAPGRRTPRAASDEAKIT